MEMCRSRDAARSAERSGASEKASPPKKPGDPPAPAGVAAADPRAGDAKCSATTVSVAPGSLPSGRQSRLASQTQIEDADSERASHADATNVPAGCAATQDTSSPCP